MSADLVSYFATRKISTFMHFEGSRLLKGWKAVCSPPCLSPSFHFFLPFSTTKFLDAVFKQTNIAPHHQEYFFEGHLYELDPNLQARNFCRTTESSPLTLLSTSEQPEDMVGVRYRDREWGWLEMGHGTRVALGRGICSSYYPQGFPISQ